MPPYENDKPNPPRIHAAQIERALDDAMFAATTVFYQHSEKGDLYAIRKAVQSLPVPVLIQILASRTVHGILPEMEG